MGVNDRTVLKWEKDGCEPPVTLMPAIIEFLGYDPYPEPADYPARLLAKRRATGWTAKAAAGKIGCNEATWGLWERGVTVPRGGWKRAVDELLTAGS
jgi:DNA-binding XRE family transcriptional regulator